MFDNKDTVPDNINSMVEVKQELEGREIQCEESNDKIEINIKEELDCNSIKGECELNNYEEIDYSDAILPDDTNLLIKHEKEEHFNQLPSINNVYTVEKSECESENEESETEVIMPDLYNEFNNISNDNVRPEVVKIHKSILSDEKVLIEIKGIEGNKEIIISDSINEEESFVLQNLNSDGGDLLAPLNYQCAICMKRYQSLMLLKKHELTHEKSFNKKKKLNEQVECNKKIKNVNNKKNLMKVDKQVLNKIKRKYVKKNKIKEDDVNESISKDIVENKEESYSCQSCNTVYRRKSSAISCLKSHKTAGVACKWCSKLFKDKVDRKMHYCSKGKKYSNLHHCEICNKTFRIKNNFLKHQRKHTQVEYKKPEKERAEIYTCSKCNATFSNKRLYEAHLSNHKTDDKVKETKFFFECNVCGENSSTLKTFLRHKLIHNKKEKKYECSRCKEIFASRGELCSHRKLHCRGGDFSHQSVLSSSKPTMHKCDICSQEFTSKELMLQHKAEHPFLIFAKDDSTHAQLFFK